MDQELQSKIANAFDKLINGAPEAWQQLVDEVQLKGYVGAGIGFVFFIFMAIIFTICFSKTNQKDFPSDGYGAIAMGVGIMSLAPLAISVDQLLTALAPSLELIKILR